MANLNIPSTRDRTLDAFKGKMVGGGARPNLFECELFFPDDAIPIDSSSDEIADKSRFLVKAAQLPASNIAPILVPFRGRNLKIAGDRTFDPWTITIIHNSDCPRFKCSVTCNLKCSSSERNLYHTNLR